MVEASDPNRWHITKALKKFWAKNSLERLKKINADRVFVVDGMEGIGKSTWAFQQACYIDRSLNNSPEKFVSRIAFSPDEFKDLATQVKNGVVIFDEAFRGLSSRAALSKENKKLIQCFMEMRQQNNIVFIVLPSFFMLDIYVAMLRSSGLFNIYNAKHGKKRAWRGFNRFDKNQIYQTGIKKGWNYFLKSKFSGYFYGKFPNGQEFEEAYLRKKAEAFRGREKFTEEAKKDFYAEKNQQIAEILEKFKEKYQLSNRKLGEVAGFSHTHINSILNAQKVTANP